MAASLARSLAAVATLAALMLVALAARPADAAAACTATSARLDDAAAYALKRATLCLLNDQREARGLRRLRLHDDLDLAARRHARDMEDRNYFSHTSLGGTSFITRIRRTGYFRGARTWRAAENLAWGSGSLETPRAVVRSWMRSAGHRRNILGRFNEIGIGIANGTPRRGLDGATYATTFGYAR